MRSRKLFISTVIALMAVALVCGSVAAASAEKPAADETPQEVGPAAYSDVIGDVILQGNSYFARYEGVRKWIEETLQEAVHQKCVQTLFGRIRQILCGRRWSRD